MFPLLSSHQQPQPTGRSENGIAGKRHNLQVNLRTELQVYATANATNTNSNSFTASSNRPPPFSFPIAKNERLRSRGGTQVTLAGPSFAPIFLHSLSCDEQGKQSNVLTQSLALWQKAVPVGEKAGEKEIERAGGFSASAQVRPGEVLHCSTQGGNGVRVSARENQGTLCRVGPWTVREQNRIIEQKFKLTNPPKSA
ncbi:hypothetical protein ElyMa_005904000 [Elysia marginata]|uniref:Uncharacterized protein n=1 Tax=Elysia marginata TaxID=1093978 RepID=A0AAV4G7X3_9GAST|nr:hypothetical protein ElyMa_005904000 [Elysia marginata]